MADNTSLHQRARQEGIESKAPHQSSEELATKEVGSSHIYDDVWGDTPHDIRDMQRLGKKQEFKVLCISAMCHLKVAKTAVAQFQLLICVGLCVYIHGHLGICPRVCPTFRSGEVASLTFGLTIRSLGAGLINGGFGGLFWTFIGTVTCYATIVASLAEMESM
jgi:choline transport protein